MKKQVFVLSILSITSGISAMSVNEIIGMLSYASGNLERAAYGTNPQITPSFYEWNHVFTTAKNFVINNSTNLLGQQDPNILNAMANIEKANKSIFDIINAIHTSSTRDALALRRLELIYPKNNTANTLYNLNKLDLTLNNKQNARIIINKIGQCLEKMINDLDKIILDYMNFL